MSLLGFTFGFGARDVGMRSGIDNAVDGIGRVNRALESQSTIARNSGITALMDSMRNFQLDSMLDQLRNAAGGTGNLTNSLEAFGTQAAVSIRPVLAQIGLVGDEFRSAQSEISGFAYSSNIDARTVADSFAAVQQSSEPLRNTLQELGLDYRQLSRLQQVTGVGAEQLVGMVGGLNRTWGMSTEQTGALLDNLTALSQEAGLGTAIWQQYSGIMSGFDEILGQSSIPRTAEEVAHLQENVVRLAGAFREGIGAPAEESLTMAMEVFRRTSEETQAYRGMLAGLDNDFGGLTSRLAETVGLAGSLDLMQSDPMAFVAALQRMYSGLQGVSIASGNTQTEVDQAGRAMVRLRAEVGTLNPNLVHFFDAGAQASDAIQRMATLAPEAAGAFNRMGEAGFSAGITLQESLERAQLAFETRLRSISRGAVRDFVRDQRTAYRELGDDIVDLSSDERWGPLVKRMSAVGQLGLVGFFVPMEEGAEGASRGISRFAAIMGIAGDALVGIAPMVGPLAFAFSAVSDAVGRLWRFARPLVAVFASWPIALAAAAVGLVFFREEIAGFALDGMKWLDGLAGRVADFLSELDGAELAGRLVAWFRSIPDQIAEFFSGQGGEMGAAASGLGTQIGRMFGEAFRIAGEFFGTVDWAGLAEDVLAGLDSFGDWLGKKFGSIDWGALGESINHGIGIALAAVWDFLSSDFLWESITSLVVWLNGIADWFAGIDFGAAVDGMNDAIQRFFIGLFSGSAEEGGSAFVQWWTDHGMEVFGGLLRLAGVLTLALGQLIFHAIRGLGALTGTIAAALADFLLVAFVWAFDSLTTIGSYAIEWFMNSVVMPLGTAIAGLYNTVVTWVTDYIVTPFMQSLSALEMMGNLYIINPIMSAFDWIAGIYDWVISLMTDNIIAPIQEIGPQMMEAGSSMVQNLWDGVIERWARFKEWVVGGLAEIRALLTGSEPEDRTSPLTDLGHSGEAFLGNILAGMEEAKGSFIDGVTMILSEAATTSLNSFLAIARDQALLQVDGISNELANALISEVARAQIQTQVDAGGMISNITAEIRDIASLAQLNVTAMLQLEHLRQIRTDVSSMRDHISRPGASQSGSRGPQSAPATS